jgi:hypothetical protein
MTTPALRSRTPGRALGIHLRAPTGRGRSVGDAPRTQSWVTLSLESRVDTRAADLSILSIPPGGSGSPRQIRSPQARSIRRRKCPWPWTRPTSHASSPRSTSWPQPTATRSSTGSTVMAKWVTENVNVAFVEDAAVSAYTDQMLAALQKMGDGEFDLTDGVNAIPRRIGPMASARRERWTSARLRARSRTFRPAQRPRSPATIPLTVWSMSAPSRSTSSP